MGAMRIRQLPAAERAAVSVPIQTYCFMQSPPDDEALTRVTADLPYFADHVTLVAEDAGLPVAEASAVPLRQNLRGRVLPMAGIAGVASLPLTRRRGHVRALMIELLGRMREAGHAVSTLYPFRPSFYERLGYAGLPKTKTTRFSPADLRPLLSVDLPGTVAFGPPAAHYAVYRALTERLLRRRHGFAVLPDQRMAYLRDATDQWLVTATVDGEVAAGVPYRLSGHGGDLVAGDLLAVDPIARAHLLRFFAQHADQVASIEVTVAPDDYPELWTTDLEMTTESRTTIPTSAPPMARILSLPALTGLPAGPAAATVEIRDDPFIAGTYHLDGSTGELTVTRASNATATLTAPAVAALVYGSLTPPDLVARGLAAIPPSTARALATLFPPATPYVHARF
jgi:predicted acetyltransferase